MAQESTVGGDATSSDPIMAAHIARMEADGAPPIAIRGFLAALARARAGDTGHIAEDAIEPLMALDDGAEIAADPALQRQGATLLDQVAVIKLNGGLGTSMGMRGPKSLVEVRDGRSFLDIVANQILALRRRHRAKTPLVLMDSFRTQAPSIARLRRWHGVDVGVPLDFLQHRVPKVLSASWLPATEDLCPDDPALCWCPPGHGDIFAAMATSGILAALQARGTRWLFVSNIDNLGATLDLGLLAYLAGSGASMLVEAAGRTDSDRKGGHLARSRADGGLILREAAQCRDDDLSSFQDIARHRYFNTNSVWFDLGAVAEALERHDGALPLPLIVNRKRLDPNDDRSPSVLQLESAMAAAVSLFPQARAVRVDRSRFAPVKTAADLLILRSDCYRIDGDGQLERTTTSPLPRVDVDPRWYRTVDDLALRFPAGMPSLRRVRSLSLRGDVRLASDVPLEGDVTIEVPAGTIATVRAQMHDVAAPALRRTGG